MFVLFKNPRGTTTIWCQKRKELTSPLCMKLIGNQTLYLRAWHSCQNLLWSLSLYFHASKKLLKFWHLLDFLAVFNKTNSFCCPQISSCRCKNWFSLSSFQMQPALTAYKSLFPRLEVCKSGLHEEMRSSYRNLAMMMGCCRHGNLHLMVLWVMCLCVLERQRTRNV